MNEIIKYLLVNFGVVGVVTLFFVWLFRVYVGKRLDTHFRLIERLKDSTAELSMERKKQYSDFLSKMIYLASQCRNNLRNLINLPKDKTIPEFIDIVEKYTDFLYIGQFLAPKEVYDLLHLYKGELERMSLFLKIIKQEKQNLSVKDVQNIKLALDSVESRFLLLQDVLRKEFKHLEDTRTAKL